MMAARPTVGRDRTNVEKPVFFPGLHHPSDAKNVERCMISVNALENRKSDFEAGDWILDSGAFTRIVSGKGHMPVVRYSDQIRRWSSCGNLLAAVGQDYMCEAFILDVTGLTVREHQELTIERYIQLKATAPPVYIMPVIQGFEPKEYIRHIEMYGAWLEQDAWVGVGSVCKRNSNVGQVEVVLEAIASVRPDLKLHGFGLKKTALTSQIVNDLLYSCDSMAWSYAARREGRNANDWREAANYTESIAKMPMSNQSRMPLGYLP